MKKSYRTSKLWSITHVQARVSSYLLSCGFDLLTCQPSLEDSK